MNSDQELQAYRKSGIALIILSKTVPHRVVWMNTPALQLFGNPDEKSFTNQESNTGYTSFIHESDRNRFLNEPFGSIEYRLNVNPKIWIRQKPVDYPSDSDRVTLVLTNVSAFMKQFQSLSQAENRWRHALDAAEEGVWEWKAESDRVYFSEQWKKMLGYSEGDIIGTLEEWDALIHPDDLPQVQRDLQSHFTGKTPGYRNIHRIRNKQGDYTWVLDKGKVIRWLENGKPSRIVGTHSDVSYLMKIQMQLENQTRELNRTRQLLETTAEMAEVGGWEYSVAEEHLSWSTTTRKIHQVDSHFKVTVDSALSFYLRDIDRKQLVQLFRRCISHFEPFDEQVQIKTKKGRIIWVRYMGRPEIDDGMCIRVYGTFQDITFHKRTETLLRKEMDALERASQLKNQFLSSMSHEIRTPINAIIGLSQYGQTNAPNLEFREYSKKIHTSSLQLLNLINSILDFSKMEYHRLELFQTPIDLQLFIQSLYVRFLEISRMKNLEFTLTFDENSPRTIVGDPDRIQQILVNLLDNSMKFTETGRITFHISRDVRPDGGEFVHFSVTDTGIGLDVTNLSQFFTPFTQGDSSSTRKYGGTGLGLSISRRLAQLMDGEIYVDSVPGSGATFTLGIPLISPNLSTSLPHLTGKTTNYALVIPREDASERIIRVFKDITKNTPLQLVLPTNQDQYIDFIFLDKELIGSPEVQEQVLQLGKPLIVFTEGAPIPEENPEKTQADLPPHFKDLPEFNLSEVHDSLIDVLIRGYYSQGKEGYLETVDIRGKSILLIHREQIQRNLIQEWLESHGLWVTPLDGSKQSFQGCQDEDEYSVILMDLDVLNDSENLPIGLTEIVPNCSSIPIIGLASNTKDQDKALRLKFDICIDKPVDFPTLLRLITRLMKPLDTESVYSGEQNPEPENPYPGLNTEVGIIRMAGDRELYKELLRKFREDSPKTLTNLKVLFNPAENLNSTTLDQAAFLVHQIKGTAANLEAIEVAQACIDCEEAIKEREDISRFCQNLYARILELNSSIDKFCNESPNPDGDSSDGITQDSETRELEENLNKITRCIEDNLIIDTSLLGRTHQLLSGNIPGLQLFDIIRQKIWSLQYDQATELLIELTSHLGVTKNED